MRSKFKRTEFHAFINPRATGMPNGFRIEWGKVPPEESEKILYAFNIALAIKGTTFNIGFTVQKVKWQLFVRKDKDGN